MRNFFERREAGRGLGTWILVALAFAAPLGFLAVQGLHLENDISTWLSQKDPESRVYSWSLEQFPSDDRIMVSWDGSTLDDPRLAAFKEQLTGALDADGIRRGGAPQVRSVVTPQDVLSQMLAQEVPLEQAIERLQGVIIGTGGLKVRFTEAGSAARDATIRLLTESIRTRCGLEIETRPAVERWVPEEGEADAPDLATAEIPQHDLEITWPGFRAHSPEVENVRRLVLELSDFPTAGEPSGRRLVQDCFSAPGSPVAVTIALSEAGDADLTGAVTAIRSAAQSVGVPESALHIGGRPVAIATLDEAVKSTAWNGRASSVQLTERSAVIVAVLALAAIVLYTIRRVRIAAALLAVSGLAVLFGVALIPLTGHSMNMLLLVLPALLLSVAVTIGARLVVAWRSALVDDPRTASHRAFESIRRPSLTAGLLTASGFLLLTISSNSPIRQFGLFAAGGILVSMMVVLYGLPNLLSLIRQTDRRAGLATDGRWLAIGALLSRRPVLIAAACCAACIGGIAGLHSLQIDMRIVRNFPQNCTMIRDYRFMEDNLAGVSPIDVIVRFGPETQESVRFVERLEIVRQMEDRLREHPQVSGALSLADFLPVQELPAADAKTRQRVLFNRHSNEIEQQIKEGGAMDTSDYLVTASQARDLLADGDAGLNGPGDEIWKITVRTALMSDVDYSALSAELSEAARSVTRYHAGANHVVTGAAPILDRTQRAMIFSLLKVSGLAAFLLGIALVSLLKNPLATVLSMLANILPVAGVLGAAAWSGEALDVASILAATIALWMGVHGTLHLLHAFRDGLRRGLVRQRAMLEAFVQCAPPIALAGAAVAAALLALAPAELGYISRFGWTAAAMVAAQSAGGLVLLPALLAGPLGALLEKSVPVRLATDGALADAHRAAPHVRFQSSDAERDAVRPAV